MQEIQESYRKMHGILTQTQIDLREAQASPMQEEPINTLTVGIEQLKGPIGHLAGVDSGNAQQNTFGPMLDLAAHGIEPVEVEAPQLIDPVEEDVNTLQAKVDGRWAQWNSLAPESHVDEATTPDGELVIRTIFKRAGLPDYETAAINLATIEKVSKLKADMEQAEADIAEEEKKIRKAKQAKAL